MLVYDVAGVLQTPYEELHITRFGEVVLEHDEYEMIKSRMLRDEEKIDEIGSFEVASVDCYYTGDHMCLTIDLM